MDHATFHTEVLIKGTQAEDENDSLGIRSAGRLPGCFCGVQKGGTTCGPNTGVLWGQGGLAEVGYGICKLQPRGASRSIPGKACLRYGQFPQAMVQLDKLAHVPNLTEPQKKLVNDLLEQTKQVIAKAPPPGQ